MALYRFAAGVIARSKGHSSTAAAAYRAGERLTDERTGQVHDYTRRTGVLWSGIYAPANAPEWMKQREQLWNGAEKAEARKDAQTAREFIVCIPHELNLEQGRRLVGDFLRENFARKGFVSDVAIHAPGKGGDDRNIHAHFLVTMRKVSGQGFEAKKDRSQNEKATLQTWRENWAKLGNRHLERAGFPGTLDHRSYEAQGIEQTARLHIGKAAWAMEKRGIPTDKAELQKTTEQRQNEIAELRTELAMLESKPEIRKPANDLGRATSHPANDNVPEPKSGPVNLDRQELHLSPPANDHGKAEVRPVNDNTPDQRPEVVPPILKANPIPGPDPAKPLAVEPVGERPDVLLPALGPTVTMEPQRAGEEPASAEVSPHTSQAAEQTPSPSTVKPPTVQLQKAARSRFGRKSKIDRGPSPIGIRALFAAAAGLARNLLRKGRVGRNHIPAKTTEVSPQVALPRPPDRSQANKLALANPSPAMRSGLVVSKDRPDILTAVPAPQRGPQPSKDRQETQKTAERTPATEKTPQAPAGPASYRLNAAELAALVDRKRREREQDRDGPER